MYVDIDIDTDMDIYIYIYIYMVPPPMYPRLSAQSRLWEGTAWVHGIGGVPVNRMFLPYV